MSTRSEGFGIQGSLAWELARMRARTNARRARKAELELVEFIERLELVGSGRPTRAEIQAWIGDVDETPTPLWVRALRARGQLVTA